MQILLLFANHPTPILLGNFIFSPNSKLICLIPGISLTCFTTSLAISIFSTLPESITEPLATLATKSPLISLIRFSISASLNGLPELGFWTDSISLYCPPPGSGFSPFSSCCFCPSLRGYSDAPKAAMLGAANAGRLLVEANRATLTSMTNRRKRRWDFASIREAIATIAVVKNRVSRFVKIMVVNSWQ